MFHRRKKVKCFFSAWGWISEDRSFAWTIPLSRMLLIHRQTPPPKYNILCVSCKSSNTETRFPDPHMFFSLVHKQITSDNEGTWHDMQARFYLDCWSRFDSVSLKERSSLAILVWDQDNLHLIWLSQLRGFDSLEAIDGELNPYGTKKLRFAEFIIAQRETGLGHNGFAKNQSHENLFLSPTEHPERLSLWLGPHPESNGEPGAGWSWSRIGQPIRPSHCCRR